MQFGTNHLGHFALTGLLLPALVARPRSRVVTVSSGAHRLGRMDFDDLMGERRYRAWGAYGQSKLANLLFTAELQRRLDANAVPILAMAAHPGLRGDEPAGRRPADERAGLAERPMELANKVLGQSAEMGALPTLFAATAPGLPGNSYVGPDGFMEQRGHPRLVDRSAAARNAPTPAAVGRQRGADGRALPAGLAMTGALAHAGGVGAARADLDGVALGRLHARRRRGRQPTRRAPAGPPSPTPSPASSPSPWSSTPPTSPSPAAGSLTPGSTIVEAPARRRLDARHRPTFVRGESGELAGVDWVFNGWGAQSWATWGKDARVAARVCAAAGVPVVPSPMVNEGGGIHVNGEGTVLLTRTVQLDAGRNPDWTQQQVEDELARTIGADRFVWLERGLTRDYDEFGTRGHIDIVACFSDASRRSSFHDQRDPGIPTHAVSADAVAVLEAVPGLSVVPVPAPDVLRDDEGWVDYSLHQPLHRQRRRHPVRLRRSRRRASGGDPARRLPRPGDRAGRRPPAVRAGRGDPLHHAAAADRLTSASRVSRARSRLAACSATLAGSAMRGSSLGRSRKKVVQVAQVGLEPGHRIVRGRPMPGNQHLGAAHRLAQARQSGQVPLEGHVVRSGHGQLDVAQHVAGHQDARPLDEQRQMSGRVRVMDDDPGLGAVPWQSLDGSGCRRPAIEIRSAVRYSASGASISSRSRSRCSTVPADDQRGPSPRPGCHRTWS